MSMKFLISALCVLFNLSIVISQTRLVLNNNSFVVIKNSAQVVIDNSSSNAITLAGSGGNIISEGETNKIKWNIGTTAGIYSVPFSNSSGNKIPVTLDVSTAGIANGSILFSTYGGASWDNSAYMPSDVTTFTSACCANNSANVIDRFWIIDPVNYTTKPSVSITFTYLDAEHTTASNTIDESTLFAQRFNPAPNNIWGDWLGTFGTANTTANIVSSGVISPSDFFRSWTLVNQSSPLPIELIYFKTNCINQTDLSFEWATATEVDNDYFTIERSVDAVTWESFIKIPSKGNSTTTQKYSYLFTDNESNHLKDHPHYFKLKQTDSGGKISYSDIVYSNCSDNSVHEINEFPNPNNGEFTVDLFGFEKINEAIEVTLTDVIGRTIETRIIHITEQKHQEYFKFNDQTPGVYYLSVKSLDKIIVKKIIHQ